MHLITAEDARAMATYDFLNMDYEAGIARPEFHSGLLKVNDVRINQMVPRSPDITFWSVTKKNQALTEC